MPVPKNKASVRNKIYDKFDKRFFAICKDLGLNGENEKNYWKKTMGVEHMADFTGEQWNYIFDELAKQLETKAKKDGTVFTRDLDATIYEVLGD